MTRTLTATEREALEWAASQIGVADLGWLYALIDFESEWNPNAANPFSSARGLLQWLDATAQGMGYQSARDLVAHNPTTEEQLRGPVVEYLRGYAPFSTLASLAMAVFYPVARGWPLTREFPSAVQRVNPGIVTVGDYVSRVAAKLPAWGSTDEPSDPPTPPGDPPNDPQTSMAGALLVAVLAAVVMSELI